MEKKKTQTNQNKPRRTNQGMKQPQNPIFRKNPDIQRGEKQEYFRCGIWVGIPQFPAFFSLQETRNREAFLRSCHIPAFWWHFLGIFMGKKFGFQIPAPPLIGFGIFFSKTTRQCWNPKGNVGICGTRRVRGWNSLFIWDFYLFWGYGRGNANSHPPVPMEKGILGILGAWAWYNHGIPAFQIGLGWL